MTHVRIRQFEGRYRLPPREIAQQARLDRVAGTLLREALPIALRRSGVPEDEVVCIRHVQGRLRARPGASDADLALAWSLALADDIAGHLALGGADVLRFRSHAAALEDFVLRSGHGDLERAWAWRNLEFGDVERAAPSGGAPAVALATLARFPRAAATVLARAAVAGALPGLLRAPEAAWRNLARAVLLERGASLPADAPPADSPAPEVRARVARALASSRIAAALAEMSRATESRGAAALSAGHAESLAALILAESDTAALLAPIAAPATALLAARLEAAETRAALAPPRAAPGSGQAEPGSAGDAAAGQAGESPPKATRPEAPEEAREPARATTRWGGLPFLLHAVRVAEFGRIWSEGPLSDRPLHESLHRLALLLLPIAADDPAALAFAGLAPGSDDPTEGESSAAELAALRAARGTIVRLLREWLAADEAADDSLLQRVCARQAEVFAEPGEIVILLPTRDLTLDVRRAGLDLNPGWLPWLGVSVRFRYVG